MKRKGFTLVEVVASLLFLSTTLISVLNLFMLNMQSSRINTQRIVAYNLLIHKLEEVKGESFANDPAVTNFNYPGYMDYDIDVVQIPNYSGNPSLKRIDVTVDWNTASGANISETVSTLVAQY